MKLSSGGRFNNFLIVESMYVDRDFIHDYEFMINTGRLCHVMWSRK
jgi:hypothetical protein